MFLILGLLLAFLLAGLGWGLRRQRLSLNLMVFGALLLILCIGAFVGSQLQLVRDYEVYVFPFSRYSWHLRDLVEHHDLNALTNDVVIFDESFRPRQDPHALEDGLNRVLRLGVYYQPTNSPLQLEGSATNHEGR